MIESRGCFSRKYRASVFEQNEIFRLDENENYRSIRNNYNSKGKSNDTYFCVSVYYFDFVSLFYETFRV